MNKKICFVFMIVPLLLGGCFDDVRPDQPYLDTVVSKSFVGTIESLTSELSDLDATHFMITESKNRVYLNSVLHDLNDYLDKNVRINGTYLEKSLNSKPVDLVFVNQIDLLDDAEKDQDATLETVLDFGLSFKNNERINFVEGFPKLTVNFLDDSSILAITLYQTGPELDLTAYMSEKYASYDFDALTIAETPYNFYRISDNQLKYVTQMHGVIYDFDLILTDIANGLDQFDAFLLDLVYFPSDKPFAQQAGQEALASTLEVEPVTAPAVEEENQEVLDPVESQEVLEFKFKEVVEDFTDKARSILPDFASLDSFAFTDNKHFYLIYTNRDDVSVRVLIDYNNAYIIKARFVEGTDADWDLTSGVNDVYDRPLTLINFNDDRVTVADVAEGYRLFETPALGFSLHYPQEWYYIRDNDSYLFALDPVTFNNVILKLSIDDTDLSKSAVLVRGSNVRRESVLLEEKTFEFEFDNAYQDFVNEMKSSLQLIQD